MKEEWKSILAEHYGMDEFKEWLLMGCNDCNRMWKILKRSDGSVAHSDWLPLINHARKHVGQSHGV